MKLTLARILLAGLLWAGATAPGLAAQADIVLGDEVTLTGSHYRLGDIARIESADTALVKQLAEIVIGRSPRPGINTRLSRNAIAARLEAVFAGSIRDFDWSGQAWIRVRSAGVAYSGERLNRQAFDFVKRQLKARYRDYKIEQLSAPRDLLLPPGTVSVSPRLQNSDYFPKRLSVWMDIHVDGEFVQTRPLWFSLSIYRHALVAERDFRRAEATGSQGLQRRYVDITRAAGRAVGRIETVDGMRLRQALPAGSILTEEMLQPLPAVASGQKVRVSVVVGGIRLDTTAIALSDGHLEQKIQVRSPNSGELYSVVVTGHAQTRVY